ncbi:MAG: glycogen/starch synthase [Bacteroidales bacterium]
MSLELKSPDLIFEVSWEVCNKIGGIYTVLSTRAKTLQELFRDSVVFIGPDFKDRHNNPLFTEVKSLMKKWKTQALAEGLDVRVGRWNVPGRPIAILVDFESFFSEKNQLYALMWEKYKVQSHAAYGDYDDACIFSYATALVIDSLIRNEALKPKDSHIVAHFNEWTTGMGLLLTKLKQPSVATVFTTHATSIGRSICGNNKPLYDYIRQYNGDQMAMELNMLSKHSLEKATAHAADCFTTVSKITALECKELLDKEPDVVTPNGFEPTFVPKPAQYNKVRDAGRTLLLNVAKSLTGINYIDDQTIIVGTSGRYEYKNKGIDLYVDALSRLSKRSDMKGKHILGFIMVPSDVKYPRKDLVNRLKNSNNANGPLEFPYLTHEVNNIDSDSVLNQMKWLNFSNSDKDSVTLIFVPVYLDGNDGVFNKEYYDLLIGLDVSVFPSYYEPWGYTPLESIAFGVPTITTDLAGFGRWALDMMYTNTLESGVNVIHRTDTNQTEVSEAISEMLARFSQLSAQEQQQIRAQAMLDAKLADWQHFISAYLEAYDTALRQAELRVQN